MLSYAREVNFYASRLILDACEDSPECLGSSIAGEIEYRSAFDGLREFDLSTYP